MRRPSSITAKWPGRSPFCCDFSGSRKKSLKTAYTAEKIRRAKANHIGPEPLRKSRLRGYNQGNTAQPVDVAYFQLKARSNRLIVVLMKSIYIKVGMPSRTARSPQELAKTFVVEGPRHKIASDQEEKTHRIRLSERLVNTEKCKRNDIEALPAQYSTTSPSSNKSLRRGS